METPGTLTDKLITVDLKMWNNQEALYEIRRMTYGEFCDRFNLPIDPGCNGRKNNSIELYDVLKKACDLNVQRNNLMNELDEKTLEMFRRFGKFMNMDEGQLNNCMARMNELYNVKPHKTY